MKIMVSYPPLENDKGVPLLSQNRQFQWFNNPTYIYPMVPAYTASLLKGKGFKVYWNDSIAQGWSYEKFLKYFIAKKPDLIIMETKTPVVKYHWEIVKDLKEIYPDCAVVLVGDHVTAMPEETMENSPVDYILTGGNYDFLMLSLCENLNKNGGRLDAASLENGIWYRENGEIRNSGIFSLNHDLNKLPFIDRELTKWKLYSVQNGNYKYFPGTYTMTARDCWHHKCTFCSWTTLYPKYSKRTPESLLDEIGVLIDKYGVKEIMDDSGAFPIGEWLRNFCRGMIKRGYNKKIVIDCNMRFGALSAEDYRLMKKAGFRLILFGLESANQKTLDRLEKKLTIEKMIESCKMAKESGLSPHITIMFGYPWETEEDIENTVNVGKMLMRKGYASTLQATIVIPYPGTPLFDECKANGWLQTEDWNEYDMRRPIMKTRVGDERLHKAVQDVYKIAFDPEFIARKIMSVRSVDDVKFLGKAFGKVVGHLTDFKK